MRDDAFTTQTRDGTRLHVHAWAPEGEPAAVVQIVHGMAEHGARYARFAGALARAGYAVVAHDQRGHGVTAGDAAHLGHALDRGSFDALVDDVDEVAKVARSRYGGRGVAIFAHSMGSFVAQAYLARHGASVLAAVLSATDDDPGPLRHAGLAIARAQMAISGPRSPGALLTKMSFGAFNKPFEPARTDFDWLSRDPAEVDKYVADPRCGFTMSAAFWASFLEGLGHIALEATRAGVPKALPVLFIAGDRDPVAKFGKGPRRLASAYRRAGLSDVTVALYADGRHELLNDTNRDEVTADVLRWLDPRVKKRAAQ